MTVCVLSVLRSFVAVAGVSTRSYTFTVTHVTVLALPPVTSVAFAVTQMTWLPGFRPAVIVE